MLEQGYHHQYAFITFEISLVVTEITQNQLANKQTTVIIDGYQTLWITLSNLSTYIEKVFQIYSHVVLNINVIAIRKKKNIFP